MEKLISIVVPMYFEEAVAEECYCRLSKILKGNNLTYEIIFINDGSTDKTMEIITKLAKKDNNVKIISFSRNFGHQIAVTAGIDKAKGDAVIVIDADLQDPPELIPKMVDLWNNGYDVVYAQRKKRQGETIFKLLTAKWFYKILNSMTEIDIPVDTGDYRLMDRKVIEVFKAMPEKNRFIRGMITWIGFKQIPIEFERAERFAGETKYPLKKMIKFALDAIVSFSSKPLKIVGGLGFFSVFLALLTFIYAICSKIFNFRNLVQGWTSIMAAITFFGGVQLISISILGEYIARINEESKKRPLYIIDKSINIKE